MVKLFRTGIVIGVLVAISQSIATADEARRIAKIGQLYGTNPNYAKPYDQALREGLRSLGYQEGKNIVFLPRYAHGDPTRFPALLEELIADGVDVFVVALTAIPAAKQATRTIPIVAPTMGASPVEDGLVASLAHPGGNLTGGCDFGGDQEGKFMQLAKEVVPNLKRAGLLFEATNPEFQKWANQFRANAETLGISVHPHGVRDLNEIRSALDQFHKERIQALFLWATPLILVHRVSILEFASHKFPVITQSRELAEAGALVSYSADFVEMWRRGAAYVDKILKGANPGDLPIERANKIDVRVNLKTARDLGITIPKSVLLQADQIISISAAARRWLRTAKDRPGSSPPTPAGSRLPTADPGALGQASGLHRTVETCAHSRSTGPSATARRSTRPRTGLDGDRRTPPSLLAAVELRLGEKSRRLAQDLIGAA